MNYYNEIKNELINNEIYKKSKDYSKNRSDLSTYYNVGKLIVEAQGGEIRARYGDGLIKEYSKKLTKELGKGYSIRTLKYMRKFYLFQKGQPTVAQLIWSHYTILLSLESEDKINYYITRCIKLNLSRDELRTKIKLKEYERLDEETKQKLINTEQLDIKDLVKDPIIIKNKYQPDEINEKMLHQLILEDMDSFLYELGEGFTYVKSEYKIKIGDTYNYIDILLFNYIYNSFVVVELKVTELKKEHIGQILVYMNYIDENIKSINHNKTIGIIICRENNEFIIKYASDKRILSKEYQFV